MISDNSRLHTLQSIEFDGYKSFSDGGPFRIRAESNLTLIIGRNNCGKSSLIDIIEGFIRYKNEHKLPTGVQGIGATFTLSGDDIEYGFDRNTSSSLVGNYYKFGSQFIGKGIALSCTDKGMKPSKTQKEIFLSSSPKGSDKLSNWESIARKIENALPPICFRRVNADRDVVPETESDIESVGFNGDGATNIIRKFINNYFLDETIVENTILNELNKIMQPD